MTSLHLMHAQDRAVYPEAGYRLRKCARERTGSIRVNITRFACDVQLVGMVRYRRRGSLFTTREVSRVARLRRP